MTGSTLRSEWRDYIAAQSRASQHDHDIRLAIAGSMTVEPLEPYVGGFLVGRGFKPRVTIGPFNQIQQICYDPRAVLGDGDFNVMVLLWRAEDLFGDLLGRCLTNPAAVDDVLREVKGLVDALAALRQTFKGTLIVSTPPYPSVPGFDLTDVGQASSGVTVFNAVFRYWMQEVAKLERVRILDLFGLQLQIGMRQAHDVRKWHLYRQPYTEHFWQEVGRMTARIIAAEKLGPKKCIVLDLDNTLWGGIVGEDGLAGIQLGDEFPGLTYRNFQRYLLHLKNKGVLLAVASKNNPDDAYEVFDTHDAMILTREDVAAFEIHWESKVESIKRIVKRLNIGLDSVVFVDDNAKEIAEVSERLPDVTCLMVPEELADLPGLLAASDLFDFADVTDEDRRRTEMIAADSIRQDAQERMSEEEFRRALNLKIDIFRVEKQHVARVTQLINKSNQFNLTTVRRSHDEVAALATASDTLVLAMNIKDKYGDYGLVGVSILRNESNICVIDTLLMSCRVLGRGAEATFLAKLAEAAIALGCREMRGRYIPTPKNAMVKDLYRRFDFTHDPETDEWCLQLDELPVPPAYVDVAFSLAV